MHVHEDKRAINETAKSGKIAREARKKTKRYSNRKWDKFKKARAKRG
jgi:hypothetical protein